jgi:hypothetical protein
MLKPFEYGSVPKQASSHYQSKKYKDEVEGIS